MSHSLSSRVSGGCFRGFLFIPGCVCPRSLKGTFFAICDCLLWSSEAQSSLATSWLIYLLRYLLEIIGEISDRKSSDECFLCIDNLAELSWILVGSRLVAFFFATLSHFAWICNLHTLAIYLSWGLDSKWSLKPWWIHVPLSFKTVTFNWLIDRLSSKS